MYHKCLYVNVSLINFYQEYIKELNLIPFFLSCVIIYVWFFIYPSQIEKLIDSIHVCKYDLRIHEYTCVQTFRYL